MSTIPHCPIPNPELFETDRVFDVQDEAIQDFRFNATVARVFDDMVDRSVPYYREIQRLTGQLVADFAKAGTKIYDLGCATGTTMALIDHCVTQEVEMVGLDNSLQMLDKCREKLELAGIRTPFELELADLNDDLEIDNASVVLLVLTLQFVRPMHRERLIKQVYDGLNPGGCVILVEKILGESSNLNRLFINHYYEMKRTKGYSELEIAQKREALENVLVPYRLTENQKLLSKVGFTEQDVFFKWYNFCGMVAVK